MNISVIFLKYELQILWFLEIEHHYAGNVNVLQKIIIILGSFWKEECQWLFDFFLMINERLLEVIFLKVF